MISLFFLIKTLIAIYQRVQLHITIPKTWMSYSKNLFFCVLILKIDCHALFFFSNQQRVDAFPRGKFEIIDISALRVLDRRTKNSSGPFHKKNLRRHGHFPNKNLRSRGHLRIKKLKRSAT